MGLFDFLKKEKRMTEEEFIEALFKGMDKITFISANGYNVLDMPAVLTCLNKMADTIGQLPLNVYLKDDKGNKERDFKNNLDYVLSTRPAANMTPTIFKKYITMQMLIFGECFCKVIRDSTGEVIAIAPLKNSTITYEINTNSGDFFYRFYENGRFVDNVSFQNNYLHLKDNVGNDGNKISIINKLGDTLGMNSGLISFLKTYLNNMVQPSFVLEANSDLNKEQMKKISTDFKTALKDLVGLPLVLPKGFSAKEYKASRLKDLNFDELLEQNKKDILSVFEMPLHVLNLDKFDEKAENNFIKNKIIPRLINIEEEMMYTLFSKEELAVRFIKFNVNGLLRGTLTERVDYYTKMFQIGAMTQNEIRRREDMNDIEGGDVPLMLENYLPSSLLGQQKKINSEGGDE